MEGLGKIRNKEQAAGDELGYISNKEQADWGRLGTRNTS